MHFACMPGICTDVGMNEMVWNASDVIVHRRGRGERREIKESENF